MPNQTDPNQPISQSTNLPVDPSSAPISMPMHTDLPPLPPAFQSVAPSESPAPPVNESTNEPVTDSGSAAPSDMPPMVTSAPKKKFGSGKIIATILGLFLLVGGVGAGLLLTQQQQVFQPKAVGCGGCSGGSVCNTNTGECEKTTTTSTGTTTHVTDNKGNVGSVTSGSGSNQVCSPGESRICSQAGISGHEACNSAGTAWGACVADQTSGAGAPACATGLDCNLSGDRSPTGAQDCTSPVSGQVMHCCPAGSVRDTHDPATNSCVSSTSSQAPPNGPVSCGSSGYSNFDAGTVSEPCHGGGYNIEKIAHTGCPANQTSCWCTTNSSNCTGSASGVQPTPPPTTPSTPAGSCQAVKAYSSTWTLLTGADLSALHTGSVVNFCVAGTATGTGTFDKGKFTINTIVQAETTTKGSGAAVNDYCQSYTIPAGVSTFNVSAQIHHSVLGWF